MLLILLLAACGKNQKNVGISPRTVENHSFSNPDEVSVDHYALNLKVDFEKRQLSGSVILDISQQNQSDTLILDTKCLNIKEVQVYESGKKWQSVTYFEGLDHPLLGTPLSIPIDETTQRVKVSYSTLDCTFSALSWMDPDQTYGKEEPFLFAISEAIFARTWIPIQDKPSNKFTYEAKIEVPANLMALMSATNPVSKSKTGEYYFKMEKPISSYLLSIAVGDLSFRKVGIRTGVYAEPEIVENAQKELVELESMIQSLERITNLSYVWGRYDVLFLPYTFPYGGMENPKLTFSHPLLIAGDKSLVSVIAHEISHSKAGNTVTHSSWDDIWLTEGLTDYLELRIMEDLRGSEYSEMIAYNAYQDLVEEFDVLPPEFTRLKLPLTGKDPDQFGFTHVPYVKGRLFFQEIENTIGRERTDHLLHEYFQKYAWTTLSTEEFIAFLDCCLDSTERRKIKIDAWVYGEGLPNTGPVPLPKRFAQVEATLSSWKAGNSLTVNDTKSWTPHEWEYFLKGIYRSGPNIRNPLKHFVSLDQEFKLSTTNNTIVRANWLRVATKYKVPNFLDTSKDLLLNCGRGKVIVPIFRELCTSTEGRSLAKQILQEANYHPVVHEALQNLISDEAE